MKTLFLILRYYKEYKYWKPKRRGEKPKEFNRGIGYFFTTGIIGHSPIGMLWETEMNSGKIGIYELVDYSTFTDPYDMISEAWYCLIGYKDTKPISECSFPEFIEEYIK